MAYNTITDGEIDAGSPVDNALLAKFRDNDEFLKANLGGAGAPIWDNSMALGAEDITEFERRVYKFDTSFAQILKSIVNVPSGYAAGVKPTINLGLYSDTGDNTKYTKFQVQVTLIGSSDAIDSTTNQETFNAQVSLTNTAKDHLSLEIDLSDGSGQVNSQAIAASDVLILELKRITDTDPGLVKLVPNLTEVSFSG